MTMNPHTEWYSIHVPAGLPERIARAAYERNMTPGEFVAQAVGQSLSRTPVRPSRVRPDEAALETPQPTFAHA